MTQELEVKAAAPQRIEVIDPIPILDTGRFEQIQRIASIMARSSLTPAHLRETAVVDDDGNKIYEHGKAVIESLPYDAIFANCFLIVNQALRWGIDPFVAASCTSVIAGRLTYEGKLVAGVLSAKLGIELNYEWNEAKGDAFGITVSGRTQKRGELKSISGTVGEWKTTRKGSPWAVTANHRRMLVYRGNREWARIFMPSIMLGIYTDDEIEALEQRRSIAPVQHALGRPQEPIVPSDWRELARTAEIVTEAAGEVGATVSDDKPPAEEAGPVDENPTQTAPNGDPSDTPASEVQSGAPNSGQSGEPSTLSNPAPMENGSQPETTAVPERTDEVLPEPTRPEDYEAFWIKCLAVAEDRKDASAEWAGQRALRTRLAVDMETVGRCKAMVDRDFPKEG